MLSFDSKRTQLISVIKRITKSSPNKRLIESVISSYQSLDQEGFISFISNYPNPLDVYKLLLFYSGVTDVEPDDRKLFLALILTMRRPSSV